MPEDEASRGEPPYFARLDPIEHHQCRDYLFSQEIVRLEGIVKPHLQQYEDDVPGLAWSNELKKFELKKIIQTLRPEDWLENRVTIIRERWGVGRKFTTQVRENPVWFNHPAARLIVLWPEWPQKLYFEIPHEERRRRIEAFSGFNEKDQLASKAYLIDPHNPSTTKKKLWRLRSLTIRSGPSSKP